MTELNAITEEEVQELAANYKAQLPGIQDRGWELGWKATLRKARVPGDNPMFRNPPKFPSSDSDLRAIISSPPVPGQSPQAPPVASAEARSVVPPDPLPTVVAAPQALQAPPEAAPEAPIPEASAVVFEVTSAASEAIAVVIEAPPEIDCNVEAAAL